MPYVPWEHRTQKIDRESITKDFQTLLNKNSIVLVQIQQGNNNPNLHAVKRWLLQTTFLTDLNGCMKYKA